MAGDYLKIDHDLPDKQEVYAVIEATGETVEVVVFRLILLWRMADRQTADGVLVGVGPKSLASCIGGKASFWEAVSSAGWLDFVDGNAVVPDFLERFGKSAKVRREEACERKRAWREDQKAKREAKKKALESQEKQGDKPGTTSGTTLGQPMGQPCDKASPVSVSVSVSSCPNGQEQEPLCANGSKNGYSDDFHAFWGVVAPHKRKSKRDAHRRYREAVKALKTERDDPEKFLLDRATAYYASPLGQTQYALNPAAWLHQGGYDDDPAAWQRMDNKAGRSPGPGQRHPADLFDKPGEF